MTDELLVGILTAVGGVIGAFLASVTVLFQFRNSIKTDQRDTTNKYYVEAGLVRFADYVDLSIDIIKGMKSEFDDFSKLTIHALPFSLALRLDARYKRDWNRYLISIQQIYTQAGKEGALQITELERLFQELQYQIYWHIHMQSLYLDARYPMLFIWRIYTSWKFRRHSYIVLSSE